MSVRACCFCDNSEVELRAVLGGGGWCLNCANRIRQGHLWIKLPVVKAASNLDAANQYAQHVKEAHTTAPRRIGKE